MTIQLSDVPTGAIIQSPDFPGYWEVIEQQPPLLTRVRRVGSAVMVRLFSRQTVFVSEWPKTNAG